MTRDEYYALLAEKHKQTDWNDRESVHAYNEYARSLRFNNLSSMGQLAFFGNQGLRQLALQEFGAFL